MSEKNWAGNLTYRASRVHHPESIEQVQELVAHSTRIRALGSRHSFNDVADTEHELVALDRLDPAIEIGVDAVGLSGGVRYGDLARELDAAGRALHNLASLPHISVAGAVATGTHGSGVTNGTLATAVRAVTLVTADGELVTLRRGDRDFDGAVVALGALGVVVRLELDTQPSFEVRQTVYDGLSWATLLDRFDDVMGAAYSVSVFTEWGDAGATQVWLKSRDDDAPDDLFGSARADAERHPLRGMPATFTTAQQGVAGAWHERLPHFRLEFTPSNGDEIQAEYLVPRRHATAALDALRPLGPRIAEVLHVSEIRTMAADPLWLSGAHGTDAIGIHFTFRPLPGGIAALLPDLEAALEPFSARPHWGKVFAMGSERIRSLYPRMDAFDELVARFDPTGRFGNDFLRRVL